MGDLHLASSFLKQNFSHLIKVKSITLCFIPDLRVTLTTEAVYAKSFILIRPEGEIKVSSESALKLCQGWKWCSKKPS